MIYNVGDKVFVLAKVVRIIEDKKGISYDVAPEDEDCVLGAMRVKDKDIKTVVR